MFARIFVCGDGSQFFLHKYLVAFFLSARIECNLYNNLSILKIATKAQSSTNMNFSFLARVKRVIAIPYLYVDETGDCVLGHFRLIDK